jgi:metal-sulfur cluster biosynthetic enzyme
MFLIRLPLSSWTSTDGATEKTMAEAEVLEQGTVLEALRDVYDPEIPVNVVDLGLIYTVEVADGDVHVEMTLTAPGCGMGPYIAQQAEWRIAEIEDVEDVQVDVVFDPPWTPDMITEDGKRLLGID